MPIDRRSVLSAGVAAGFGTAAVAAGPRSDAKIAYAADGPRASAAELGLKPGAAQDQSHALQKAIDEAANRKQPLLLPPGRFHSGPLQLRTGLRLVGAAGTTILEFAGGQSFLMAENADGVLLEALTIDGAYKMLDPDHADGLICLRTCRGAHLRDLNVSRSIANAISLQGTAGSVSDCTIAGAMQAGIRSLDASGLEILHNAVVDCANNGIQVWRSETGEDGTVVSGNRVLRIRADSGGSGQNGNGVNVFRAGGVLVSGNRFSDCAYSAVRGNAASDMQIVANSCARLGEVALYAEFGFQGALIANNLVDRAATGISVTNFNEGGRLAVVQGNLLRNLFRREQEPQDKRGNGIAVEADTAVNGNVIENAPAAGIVIGWGAYMRQVTATANLIRKVRVGILVSSDPAAGACLLANNMISEAGDGGIRAMNGSGDPVGPDLARTQSSDKRLSVSGNMIVETA
jgi:uncharacterized secreted repeat protein (TIGR03808 family)